MGNNFLSGMSSGLFQVPFKRKNKIKKQLLLHQRLEHPRLSGQ
jgi:hypothetical protein